MKAQNFSRYIYLLPILICLSFALFFYWVSGNMEKERNSILFNDKRQVVDLTAMEINQFVMKDRGRSDESFYSDWLRYAANSINIQPSTVCVLMNHNLNTLSNPSDLFQDDYFIKSVQNNDSGTVQIVLEDTQVPVYYRWIPIDQKERYLLAVAVQPNRSSAFDSRYVLGVAALILFVLAINNVMLGIMERQRRSM